jgi:hypothetical protein
MTALVRRLGESLDMELTVRQLVGYVISTAASLWLIWALLVIVIVLYAR